MSDSAKLKQPATYDDILALPEGIVGEIIDGTLYTHPRPAGKHAYTAMKVGSALDPAFGSKSRGGPGGWIFLFEPQLNLFGKQDVVPDVAGWKEELLSAEDLTNLSEARIEVTPHWVCEVISPSSIRMDKVLKSAKYAEGKVFHYWLADPEQRTLEVRKLQNEKWVVLNTFEGTEKVRAEPFESIEIDLGAFWGPTKH
jgi:Uma2 family endonuclease